MTITPISTYNLLHYEVNPFVNLMHDFLIYVILFVIGIDYYEFTYHL